MKLMLNYLDMLFIHFELNITHEVIALEYTIRIRGSTISMGENSCSFVLLISFIKLEKVMIENKCSISNTNLINNN